MDKLEFHNICKNAESELDNENEILFSSYFYKQILVKLLLTLRQLGIIFL